MVMSSVSSETTAGAPPEATSTTSPISHASGEWNAHVISAEVVGGGRVVEGSRLLQHRRCKGS
jgi:hypothetical protein